MSENNYNPSLYKQESIPEAIPETTIPETISETIPDKIVTINNYKDGCEKSITFKIRIDEIRTMRNKLLKDSDYYLLPDITIEENKLQEIKEYRQQLREFMNKLMNDEIICNIWDDDFEQKYLKPWEVTDPKTLKIEDRVEYIENFLYRIAQRVSAIENFINRLSDMCTKDRNKQWETFLNDIYYIYIMYNILFL